MPIFYFFIFKKQRFSIYLERTLLLSQMFSLAALPQENCRHCSGRKPPTATWLLSCPHTWWSGRMGRLVWECTSVCCALCSALSGVCLLLHFCRSHLLLVNNFPEFSLPAKGTSLVGPWWNGEVTSASFLYPSPLFLLGLGHIPGESNHYPSHPTSFKWQNSTPNTSLVLISKESSAQIELFLICKLRVKERANFELLLRNPKFWFSTMLFKI